MTDPIYTKVIDATQIVKDLKTPYRISWTPSQVELDACTEANEMYFVLVREPLTTAGFLEKYHMAASSYCCVHYVAPEVTDADAEEWLHNYIKQLDSYLAETAWWAPAGTRRGQINVITQKVQYANLAQ